MRDDLLDLLAVLTIVIALPLIWVAFKLMVAAWPIARSILRAMT
jgi:hypothetical protein